MEGSMFGKLKNAKKEVKLDEYLVGLDIGTEFIKALVARVQGEKIYHEPGIVLPAISQPGKNRKSPMTKKSRRKESSGT